MSLEKRFKVQQRQMVTKTNMKKDWRPGSSKLGAVTLELMVAGGRARFNDLWTACSKRMSKETFVKGLLELERRKILKRERISRKHVEIVINYRNKEYPGLGKTRRVITSIRNAFIDEKIDIGFSLFADPNTHSLRKFLLLTRSQRKEVVRKLTQLLLIAFSDYFSILLGGPAEFSDYPLELMQSVYNEQFQEMIQLGYKWILELQKFDHAAMDEGYTAWFREMEQRKSDVREELSKLTGVEWEFVCINCGTPYGTESEKITEIPEMCVKCGQDPYPKGNIGRSGLFLKAPVRRLTRRAGQP